MEQKEWNEIMEKELARLDGKLTIINERTKSHTIQIRELRKELK